MESLHQSSEYEQCNHEIFTKSTGPQHPQADAPVGQYKRDAADGKQVSADVKQRTG